MAVASGFTASYGSPNANHIPMHPSHLSNGYAHPPSPLQPKDSNRTDAPREPFMRLDTLGMKSRVLDVLKGKGADVYLRDLRLFLVGKLKRDEWDDMMGKVLDTPLKRQLHNQLLTALLHNASCPTPISTTPTLPLHPVSSLSFDLALQSFDPAALMAAQQQLQAEDALKPRRRVRKWVLGMKSYERERVKAMGIVGREEIVGEESSGAVTEMNRGWQGSSSKRKLLQNFEPTSVPYCRTTGVLPSPEELQVRLQAIATEHGLPRGCSDDLGEFVSAAVETHLDGLFYAAWQMIQANPTEDSASEDVVPHIAPSKAAEAPVPVRAISMHATGSTGTSPSNISDDLPARASGTTDAADGDIEMRDAAVAIPDANDSATSPVVEQHPVDPFAPRTLTLGDFQTLLSASPNLLPNASSSLYKLRTGIYAAFEAEELVAERLSKERDERYQIKQAQVLAQYRKDYEQQSKQEAQQLLREREIKMMSAASRRKGRGGALSLGMGLGIDRKLKLDELKTNSQQRGGLSTAADRESSIALATADSNGSASADKADDGGPMDIDGAVIEADNGTNGNLDSPHIPNATQTEKPLKTPSKPYARPTPLGTPGVGGIILRPSAKARLAQCGYTGPLGGQGVGLMPVAANATMAGELQTLAFTDTSRPINKAVEQLKQEMLFHELLKPVPLPAAADGGREGDSALMTGQAMGLEGEMLQNFVQGERKREEHERQRTAVLSAMSGLPVNSGSHWAYVDPALLLKDVLG